MTQFTLARARATIHLGEELGRGGEGAVFGLKGSNDRVAKIYSSPPDPIKVQKLVAMAEYANPTLLRIAA